MAQATHTELEFANGADLDSFLSGLDYVKLPGRPFYSHVARGFDDYGRPTVTFARRCYSEIGQPIRLQLAEMLAS